MAHDFSHPVLHDLADWPVLKRIVARRNKATRLDSRGDCAEFCALAW